MLRRHVLLPVLTLAVMLGVASATSLGSFTGISLWATAYEEQTCHVADPDLHVTFKTGGLLSGLTALLLDALTITEADFVGLENLSGDCAAMRPVVVVIGDHDGDSGTPERVLSRTMLEPISDTSDIDLPLNVAAVDDSELDGLLGTSVDPNEVRVGFCPVGVTSCEP